MGYKIALGLLSIALFACMCRACVIIYFH